jgi:hypothetical protein
MHKRPARHRSFLIRRMQMSVSLRFAPFSTVSHPFNVRFRAVSYPFFHRFLPFIFSLNERRIFAEQKYSSPLKYRK